MLTPTTKIALDNFAKKVVKNSKQRLSRKNSDTRNLEGSIGYDLKVHKNSFSLTFSMLDYGEFVDEGVRGAESSSRAPQSPFSYTKAIKPSAKHFMGWAKRKGLNPFAVRESVWSKGTKPTNFFKKPFEYAFDQLPDLVVEQFGLDVDEFLEQALNI